MKRAGTGLILAIAVFLSPILFSVYAQEKTDNILPAGMIPGIQPGSQAEKALQEKIQQAAAEIEIKCSQFKGDDRKFNECVNKYALEAAKSIQQLISQSAASQKPIQPGESADKFSSVDNARFKQ
jgi:hypothetical protein